MGVCAGFCMYDVVVNKFTFAISSPDEFLSFHAKAVTKGFQFHLRRQGRILTLLVWRQEEHPACK